MRERDAGCVFVGAIKPDSFHALTVHEAAHEHHHHRE